MDDVITVEYPPSGLWCSDRSRYTWTYRKGDKGMEPLERVERKRTQTIISLNGLSYLEFEDGSRYVQTKSGDSYDVGELIAWLNSCSNRPA